MKSFPFFRQLEQMDCGPTCLLMISKYYGKSLSIQTIRNKSYISKDGVTLLNLSNAAEEIGFRTMGVVVSLSQLLEERPLPCIVHFRKNHFIIIHKIDKKFVYIADPAYGLTKLKHIDFAKGWGEPYNDDIQISATKGVALLLETSPKFYEQENEKSNLSLNFLWSYFFKFKRLFLQLLLGLIANSLILLIIPFLTQAIVDVGISKKDLSFLTVIFIAQFVLYLSQTGIGLVRSWILLHISSRINISLISNFLLRLTNLPISYFDGKSTGGILQRIGDHQRIESFLTSTTLDTFFSAFNLVIFSVILIQYDVTIFLIYIVGSSLYIAWIWLFLSGRRKLDYKNFDISASNQSSLIQIITGMQEIKLHNAEKKMRWDWESLQATLFKLNVKSLSITQLQTTGGNSINEVKNLILSFMVAKTVIEGNMTLGMMLSVQYIIGSLNAPLSQLISFIQSAQDAKISLERLKEIDGLKPESDDALLSVFPTDKSIHLKNVSFSYEGPNGFNVLENINLTIPEGKVTAIVGTSGSGKTTLIKLLLKFYSPTAGDIFLGSSNLNLFKHNIWRSKCGSVLQDGFMFSDTIAKNIAISEDYIDFVKLGQAVKIANIHEFVDSLPLGFNTKIGAEGSGLSQGQKQRLLIARAVYKDPEYLFFDEATNALDANNERKIVENLANFFHNRTVIVIAHRLSTVQQADQIIVMEKGEIKEVGNHQQLINKKDTYYNLIKNQLNLGK